MKKVKKRADWGDGKIRGNYKIYFSDSSVWRAKQLANIWGNSHCFMNSPCYIREVCEYFILDQKHRLEKNFQATNSWYKRLLPPTPTHLVNLFLKRIMSDNHVYNIVPLCQIFCPYMKYCVPVSNIVPLYQTWFLTFLFFSATRCSKKRAGC